MTEISRNAEALLKIAGDKTASVIAERDRAHRACEQMGERITGLENALRRLIGATLDPDNVLRGGDVGRALENARAQLAGKAN